MSRNRLGFQSLDQQQPIKEDAVRVAYNALGKSETGKAILGHVFFESNVNTQNGRFAYTILAYHFLCENLFHAAAGLDVGHIHIPVGPTADVVLPGSGVWQMGAWVTNTGVLFQAVDNVVFQQTPERADHYRHLPPRMELNCDFVSAGPFGPFRPVGWLKLIWDPQFAITKGLKSDFFGNINN